VEEIKNRKFKMTASLRKEIKRIVDNQMSQFATRDDFSELKAIVKELAEAQKRTEVKVAELAEAQKRTEVKVRIGRSTKKN